MIRVSLKDRGCREWLWWVDPQNLRLDVKKLGFQYKFYSYDWKSGNDTKSLSEAGFRGYTNVTELLTD